MADSAVLFHSYSFAAPPSRHISHEDNTIHALSQSVSFGRFMSENLEWGKWSSFSHKKYVDEAEKFSQPGSVAQKKAFFEDYYKKIAEAKKAKASNESSDPKQEEEQKPESVAVLLNTLETLTKDEVKEEGSDKSSTEDLVLSIEKDEEPEGESVVVLEQEGDEEPETEGDLVDKSLVRTDDSQVVNAKPDEMDEKENPKDDGAFVEEKEKERISITKKNSSVLRSSMEKQATSETSEKAMEVVSSPKTSEKPITHSTLKKNEKAVSPKCSFWSRLMGNTKTEDQNQTRKKRKAAKKQNKPFLCLCFKPEMVGETELARNTKTQKMNL